MYILAKFNGNWCICASVYVENVIVAACVKMHTVYRCCCTLLISVHRVYVCVLFHVSPCTSLHINPLKCSGVR